MKTAVLFFVACCSLHSLQAQVTPYTGGIGSGYVNAASPVTICSMYYGGISSGSYANSSPQTVCSLYSGDAGDGYGMRGAACGSALPVNLLTFYGEKEAQKNVLHWIVAAGYLAKYFEVERSIDGRSYTVIGKVDGNTGYNNSFIFIDDQPNREINFYRLRITDLNNRITYSNILVLKNFTSGAAKIYPNPAVSAATLYFESVQPGKMQLSVFKYDGRLIVKSDVQIVKGANYIGLDLKNLVSGIYFVAIGETNARVKLVVVKE